jgi:hypothetical protein
LNSALEYAIRKVLENQVGPKLRKWNTGRPRKNWKKKDVMIVDEAA